MFKSIEHSIIVKNKNVYSNFTWTTQKLLDKISTSNNLTDSQESNLFEMFSYKARQITDLAIENEIYYDIEFYSTLQIQKWIINKKSYGHESLLHYFNFLLKLIAANKLTHSCIIDYFDISRNILTEKIDKEIKQTTIETIIAYSFSLVEQKNINIISKSEIIRHLKSLNESIENNEDLIEVKIKYSKRINEI